MKTIIITLALFTGLFLSCKKSSPEPIQESPINQPITSSSNSIYILYNHIPVPSSNTLMTSGYIYLINQDNDTLSKLVFNEVYGIGVGSTSNYLQYDTLLTVSSSHLRLVTNLSSKYNNGGSWVLDAYQSCFLSVMIDDNPTPIIYSQVSENIFDIQIK